MGGIVRAIDGVSFEIREGEALGLVGESGSGKSMTALGIIGLLPKAASIESGSVFFGETDLLSLSERELSSVRGGEIGMTFQDPATYLNPVMKVGRQISEVLKRHEPGTNIQDRVLDLLDLVRLPRSRAVVDLYPHELSGGMRQRILLAIALAASPRLLIADEPTTALDVTIQAQILELIRSLRDELGLAVLLISHDLGVVAEVCDSVCVLYAGRVMEKRGVDELFENPLHPYTRGLLASTLSVHERKDTLITMKGSIPSPVALPSGCRFHPRCPEVMDRCAVDEPTEIEIGERGKEGTVACWLTACPPGDEGC
jgi:oligopeptide/dipeptide ABC transporter ATP-binding protein